LKDEPQKQYMGRTGPEANASGLLFAAGSAAVTVFYVFVRTLFFLEPVSKRFVSKFNAVSNVADIIVFARRLVQDVSFFTFEFPVFFGHLCQSLLHILGCTIIFCSRAVIMTGTLSKVIFIRNAFFNYFLTNIVY